MPPINNFKIRGSPNDQNPRTKFCHCRSSKKPIAHKNNVTWKIVQNSFQKLASNHVKFSSNDYSTLTESYLTTTVLNTQRSTNAQRVVVASNFYLTIPQRLTNAYQQMSVEELSLHSTCNSTLEPNALRSIMSPNYTYLGTSFLNLNNKTWSLTAQRHSL
jgi:hypothetical protein